MNTLKNKLLQFAASERPVIREQVATGRDMNEILHRTYGALVSDGLDLSARQFSKKYLGRCETYFAYLKSGGHQVSTDALLKLWSKLNEIKDQHLADMETARTQSFREILERRARLFAELSQNVFHEIKRQI